MKLQIDLKKRVVRYEGDKDDAFKYCKQIIPLDCYNFSYLENLNVDLWSNPFYVSFKDGKSDFYHTMNSAVQLGDGAAARTYYKHKFYNIKIV